ncbi:MAG: sulfatase [Pirellulaceae bacterium]|nr:sulfatase [Pirellulaceae bacterium]
MNPLSAPHNGSKTGLRRLDLIRLSVLVMLGLIFQPSVWAEIPRVEQPNIIVFLVDDLGWQDTSVAFSGKATAFQKHYRTPNLEQLARRGVTLTNAYAHCVCSPTRTSILTGQNPARHGVTNWTLYPDRDQSGKTKTLAAPTNWRKEGLQPEDQTLPQLLKKVGYYTIHCGKAHWGGVGTAGSNPENLGFDINIAGHSAGAPGSYQGQENYGNHADGSPKIPWGVPGLEKYYGTNTHLTDALTAEVSAALDIAIDSGKPFFLYMAPYAVHTPIQAHPRFIEHYKGQKYSDSDIVIPEEEARYASMVEGYDAALGDLMAQVRDRNIADKTLILFTSDNGGLSVHGRNTTPLGTGQNTHNWPLREGKGSAYEGGTRVPAILAWATPDRGSPLQKRIPIVSGSTSDRLFISEDIFPTICRWAGFDMANAIDNVIDGKDVTDHLTGNHRPAERSLLFHYPHVWGPQGRGYQPHSALRYGKWKVIYFYDPQQWELYDLEKDISETQNLADALPAQLVTMQSRLIKELNSHKAQFPVDIQTGQARLPQ